MKQLETDILTVEQDYEPDFFEENEKEFEQSENVQSQFYTASQPIAQKREFERFDDYSNEFEQSQYEEYEVIKTFSPKKEKKVKQEKELNNYLNSSSEYSRGSETYIYQRSKQQKNVSNKTRGRIIVYCCALVALLLCSLCIVNLVNINTLHNNNSNISSDLKDNEKLNDALENIKNDSENNQKDEDNNAFVSSNVAQKYTIKLLDKQQVVEYQSQTNFFDKICNFIYNLFGG